MIRYTLSEKEEILADHQQDLARKQAACIYVMCVGAVALIGGVAFAVTLSLDGSWNDMGLPILGPLLMSLIAIAGCGALVTAAILLSITRKYYKLLDEMIKEDQK